MARTYFTANNFGYLKAHETKAEAQHIVDADPNCITSVMSKTEAIKKYGKEEVKYALCNTYYSDENDTLPSSKGYNEKLYPRVAWLLEELATT